MMLHYGLSRNKGAVLITGALGTGKTSLCHKLVEYMDPAKTFTVWVVNPDLNPLQMHKELLAEMGVKVQTQDRQKIGRELQNRVREIFEQGKKILLVIDNAHQIKEHATFEELRMLLNLQTGEEFLVNVLMAGQPSICETLAKYQEVDQMLAVRERLQPMNVVEMQQMLLYRMRISGYTGDSNLFDSDAIVELHRFTKGVPRLVCHLADHALMLGKNEKARAIDGLLMHLAIEEFYGQGEDAA